MIVLLANNVLCNIFVQWRMASTVVDSEFQVHWQTWSLSLTYAVAGSVTPRYAPKTDLLLMTIGGCKILITST